MELLRPPQELLPRGHPLKGGGLQDIEDILGQYQRMTGRLQMRGITPPPEIKKKGPTMWERISDIFEREEAMTANVAAAMLRGEGDLGKLAEEARKGLAGKKKTSYGEILEKLGVKGPAKFVGGLALGMVTAPSTYVPFGKILSKLAPVGRALKVGAKAFPVTRPLIEGGEQLAKIGVGMFSHSPATRSVTQRLVREAEEKALAEGLGPTFKYILKGIGDTPAIKAAKEFDVLIKQIPARRRALIATGAIELPARIFEGMEVPQRLAITKGLEKGTRKKATKELVKAAKSYTDLLTGKFLPEAPILDGIILTARQDPEMFMRHSLKNLGVIKTEKGLIKGMLPDYATHSMTKVAHDAMADNTHPAFTKLKRIFEVTKDVPRGFKKGAEFLGETLHEGSIKEVNKISLKKLGLKLFEEDPVAWFPRYIGRFVSQVQLEEAMGSLPRDINLAAGEQIFKKIPKAGVSKGMAPVAIQGLEGYQTLPEIAKGLEATRKVFTTEEGFNQFLRLYDRFLGHFKYTVVAFPGTQALNLSGGVFNNFIKGLTTPGPYLNTQKFMHNVDDVLLKGPKGKTMKISKLALEMERRGYAYGMIRGDLGEIALKKATGAKGTTKALQTAYRAPAALIENIERSLRLPLAVDVWQKTGSLDEAYKAVISAHFLYSPEGLTRFERDVMKRLIPFYSWMRNNTPFQLENFFKQTPKYSAVFRGTRLLTSDKDIEAGRVPEWLREEIAFKVPKDVLKFFGVKVPKDLYVRLNTPLTEAIRMDPRSIASAVSPFIRTPIEMLFNRQTFSGRNIFDPNLPEEYRKMRTPAYLRHLPAPIKSWLGYQKVQRKTVMGGTEDYYEADAQKVFLLKSLFGPMSRLYWEAGKVEQLVGATESTPLALMNAFSPFRFATVEPEEQEYYNLRKERDQLQAVTSYLMQRGIIPPAREDPAYQNWLKQQKLITLPPIGK